MAKAKIAAMPAGTYGELSLAGTFQLTSPKSKLKAPITLPGDVHTALLAAGEIPDPYFGANEVEVMWVNRTPWTVERTFDARQLPQAEKVRRATYVFDTSAPLEATRRAVAALVKNLRAEPSPT